MKSSNLIVVKIGGDKTLRSQRVGQAANHAGIDPELLKTLQVIRGVFTNGCHGHGIAAKKFQVISDIARTATELTPHSRNQKRYA